MSPSVSPGLSTLSRMFALELTLTPLLSRRDRQDPRGQVEGGGRG